MRAVLGGGAARAALAAMAAAALSRCGHAGAMQNPGHESSSTPQPGSARPKRSLCTQACQVVCDGGDVGPECPCVQECQGTAPLTMPPLPTGGVGPGFARPRGKPYAVCSKDGLRALPTLLLLGVQKGGTTSLDLDLHNAFNGSLVAPKIPPARKNKDPEYFTKELHFFDKVERFSHGAKFYGAYFPRCHAVRSLGKLPTDACPNYFGSESWHGRKYGGATWRRAATFYAAETDSRDAASNLTFVVILRDPAARYISAFNHLCLLMNQSSNDCSSLLGQVQKHVVHPGCKFPGRADSVESCGNNMLRVGIYWVALMSWANEFPNTRLIVTTFTHYHRDPNSVLSVVGDAMGVVPNRVDDPALSNAGSHHAHGEAGSEAVRLLNTYYEWHSKFFWRVLGGLVWSRPDRVAFVGTFGEF